MSTTLAPRTIFGSRYKIVSLLGRGGMGHVYRAEHLGLRKEVALKVIGAELLGDIEMRFEREARATARLDHPGCIRILDYGRTTDRRQFIAMELIDGPTLASELRVGARFTVARAVRIARELLTALAHAHARGVLHRDVKPENVMFSHKDGTSRTVLIDFGLARLCDDGPLTVAGVCIGSPSYLAPERLLGRLYDARADLYSVGVVLYEMLAGARPFAGDSPREIMRCHLERPARPLRAWRRDVSPALEQVVLRALAKEPARRYADAEEMLAALEDVPVLEQLAVQRVLVARAEEAPTTAFAELQPLSPSLPRRLWSWIRYGAWRWNIGERTAV
ncbi:MAG TPA: serine/threonine-protein kinase [Kofleriaceae bacterium]|nr:serine/threonine-protein kinase [Kofleriaceae bacterium]